MGKQRQQRVPIAINISNDDGLGVLTKLGPG